MSFTVEQIMERTGITTPGIAIAHIREAFMEMSLLDKKEAVVRYIDVKADEHQYDLGVDTNVLVSVSVRNEDDSAELLLDADRIFTGTPTWTNTSFAGTFSTSGDLTVAGTASNQSCYLNQTALMTVGHKYRMRYDASIVSGSYELQSYTGSDRYGAFKDGEDEVIEFTALETDKLKLVGITAGTASFDNFSLKERGKTEYVRAKEIIGNLSEVWTDEEAT
jgi:hypothetical protein